jgi:hypothetical protein
MFHESKFRKHHRLHMRSCAAFNHGKERGQEIEISTYLISSLVEIAD